mmetsp:Transcript_8013/g.26640  ORF Transcript_8013/g.26640 Transcript_8013/m.26640 type:complete len:246 (-) Transcript_8013:497-1234(-)
MSYIRLACASDRHAEVCGGCRLRREKAKRREASPLLFRSPASPAASLLRVVGLILLLGWKVKGDWERGASELLRLTAAAGVGAPPKRASLGDAEHVHNLEHAAAVHLHARHRWRVRSSGGRGRGPSPASVRAARGVALALGGRRPREQRRNGGGRFEKLVLVGVAHARFGAAKVVCSLSGLELDAEAPRGVAVRGERERSRRALQLEPHGRLRPLEVLHNLLERRAREREARHGSAHRRRRELGG